MTLLDEIKKPIAPEFEVFQAALARAFETDNVLLKEVFEHVYAKRGKQMRPIILLLSAQMVGEVNQKSVDTAVGMELLHTASLLHDDVVDGSALRRAQVSVNEQWGNKVAVLVGDYMLSKSLSYAASTGDVRVLEAFASVGQSLSAGELLQLSNAKRLSQTEADYFSVIRNKTARLFAICAKSGAITSGASDEMIERVAQFGEYLGMCFQLKDDLLDYSESDELGKPTMHDVCDGKVTLPLIAALDSASDEARSEVWSMIEHRDFTEANLVAIRDFVKQWGGVAYAQECMELYKQKAVQGLSVFDDSAAKQALVALLDYTIVRAF